MNSSGSQEGALAADNAIKAVKESHAFWLAAAEPITSHWLSDKAEGFEFTSDDIWFVLEDAALAAPREPRAMGALLRNLKSGGRITGTSTYTLSIRMSRHNSPIRVWKKTA